ncbi:DUF1206 domain-containing protein [Microbacterium sp. G2-8]|uniref:DUF1206 domain-containing protein n=1 Tax=Microbacterium sp. G2-8 TaxID=2842454 RepID=UPI001C89B26A|nr:DUF1206 domain-containing protein [Microbacterium sp. G2-8]
MNDPDDIAEDAAEEVTRNPVMRVLARAGFVANGVVHGLMGAIALTIAFGESSGSSDQRGALKVVAEAPFGFAALWIAAIALCGLAAWSLFDGILTYGGRDATAQAKKWGRRLGAWILAIVYASLGVLAAVVAVGARGSGESSAESASRGVLGLPGGPILLGLGGLVIAGVGVGFGVIGVRGGFRKRLKMPGGATGTTVMMLGVVGYCAKGAALLVVGILLVVAAITVDPDAAGSIDGALQALRDRRFGPLAVAVVGVGLIAYGLFLMLRGKYARLSTA